MDFNFYRSLRSNQAIGAKERTQRKIGDSDIRKDKLRRLLVAKYQRKFGKLVPVSIIVNQVNRFASTMPLTGRNLEILEERILAAVGKGKGKGTVNAPAAETDRDGLKATGLAAITDYKKMETPKKTGLIASQEYNTTGDSSGLPTEDDEWGAIMKFNNALYQEEMRQEQLKKIREKKYIRSELDKQIQEKNDIKRKTNEEANDYLQYQTRYLAHQDAIERQKQEERRQQIFNERMLRDKQLMEDATRKEMEESESKAQDKRMVERMRFEMDLERKAEREMKQIQKDTITKMMEESMRLKEKQKEAELLEKQQDIKRQEQQNEIAEMQEREWRENMARKDERNRLLMETSLQAGGGKTIRDEAALEDQRMKEQMRIINEKQDEDDRIWLEKFEDDKRRMREMLDKQIKEQEDKKMKEKDEIRQQAVMWNEEEKLLKKQDEINFKKEKNAKLKNQDYLMNQMVASKQAKNNTGMTHREYLLNKRIVDDMKVKQEKLRATASGFH